MTDIDDIIADFEVIDDWEERYRYLIELGKDMPDLAEAERTEETKVRGCASQVWLVSEIRPDPDGARLYLRGDSDAHIVRGLVSFITTLYSGRKLDEVVTLDPEKTFDRIKLREHLTPQRSNGVNSMIERIRRDARAGLAAA